MYVVQVKTNMPVFQANLKKYPNKLWKAYYMSWRRIMWIAMLYKFFADALSYGMYVKCLSLCDVCVFCVMCVMCAMCDV